MSNNELMGLVLKFDESNDGKVEFDGKWNNSLSILNS